jgi:hypothetical protein
LALSDSAYGLELKLRNLHLYPMTTLQKWIVGVTGAVLLAMNGWIFWYISQTQLSTQLSTLFNVLLTIFSVLISLVVSHFYFDASRQQTINDIKSDYQKNNKLYSQKAAEKVDNLSNELTKLSIYLQQSIDTDNIDNPATSLLVMEEKVRSAIHIVETLKSINDKSLSDWLGVLDEEDLEEQNELREEQREEREKDFQSLLDNYRNFVANENAVIRIGSGESERLDTVHTDINELTKRIDKLATNIIGTPIKTRKNPVPKEELTMNCPECAFEVKYRQRPSETSVKGLKCSNCGTKLMSRWSVQDGFNLSVKLIESVGSTPPKALGEEEIERIKEALPQQPWEKGSIQKIAKELEVSTADMNRAINILVHRGELKLQVDGELYELVKNADSDSHNP